MNHAQLPSIALSLLLCTLGLCFHIQGVAQNASPRHISGVVLDDHFIRPIPGARIHATGLRGWERSTTSDSAGHFLIALEEDSVVLLQCSSEGMMAKHFQVNADKNDTVLVQHFQLAWAKRCIDSFAPGYIHFAKGAICPNDSLAILLNEWTSTLKDLLHRTPSLRIQLLSAASFDEPPKISKRRARCVKQLLLDGGIQDSLIHIEDLRHDPFYYCRRCEGCFTRYEYGDGELLSKDIVARIPHGELLDALRRTVHIGWISDGDSPSDRTLKPVWEP